MGCCGHSHEICIVCGGIIEQPTEQDLSTRMHTLCRARKEKMEEQNNVKAQS